MSRKQINQISTETESAILRKSAYSLPNRPSEAGMKAEDVKKAFYKSIVDTESSLLSEMKRVITEANESDSEIEKQVEDLNETIENNQSNNENSFDELNAKVNNFSNPNILINGDFRINQRGQTSYSGDNSIKYFVDRWCFYWSSGFSYDTQSKLLTATSNGSIAQYIEDSQQLLGKTLTLSCKINGTVYSKTATLNSSYNSNTYIIDENIGSTGFKMQLYWTSSSLLRVYLATNSAPASITIDYIKLEIGSVATAFSPRPYAEELAMCQRYYIKMPSNTIFAGRGNSTNVCSFMIPLPVTHRSAGSMSISNLIVSTGNTSYETNTVRVQSMENTSVGKNVMIETDLNTMAYRNAYNIYSTAVIELDAEIY